jgi:hypothetical protein
MGYTRCSDFKGRFIGYGLPIKAAVDLQADILKWERNSGPEWTVDRLKSLKQDFVRLQADLEPLTWVRKNREGGWYGVWGFLRRYAARSLKNFEIVLNCLMSYSSFVPDKPTEKHIEAMKASVQAEPVYIPGRLKEDIASHARAILGELKLGPSKPLITFRGRVSTKAPIWGSRSVEQHDHLEQELRWIEDPYHNIFLNRHYESYGPVLEGLSNISLRSPLQGLSAGAFHLSEMGPFETVHSRLRPPFSPTDAGSLVPLTKDGGWKVRWIASPYRIHQLALHPLGSALFRELSNLPWDCTYDQSKPYSHVQEHLRKGGTAYAVDLSSATDHFPLDLQLSVLRSLFPNGEHQIELFHELSRSDWDTRKYGVFRWTKGQPMGLYPSFPSFALTHGVLLDYLAGGVPGRFYVLGDDVIILHKPTYESYIRTLDVLGCPFNPSKSIVSDKVTEFAGKIITPERIVSAYKWRDVSSKNFMELMRTFGQRFEVLLRRRERAVYRKVGGLLPPYGCNHSRGLARPLEEVVFETEMFQSRLPEAHVGAVHTSFLHRLAEIHKPGRPGSLFHKVSPGWFEKQAARLDERTRTAFEKTPFRSLPGDRGVLADVLAVNDDLIELPAVGPRKRVDCSILDWYEDVLGLADK